MIPVHYICSAADLEGEKAKKRKTSSPPPAAQVQAENSENAEHPKEENAG